MKIAKCIIGSMGVGDWEAVKGIYQDGIATGNATVDTHAPDWERWDGDHRPDCRLVASDGDEVVGWAALSPVSARAAYSGVAEVSVYVSEQSRGKGVGKLLLSTLVTTSESAGIWTLQAADLVDHPALRFLMC